MTNAVIDYKANGQQCLTKCEFIVEGLWKHAMVGSAFCVNSCEYHVSEEPYSQKVVCSFPIKNKLKDKIC